MKKYIPVLLFIFSFLSGCKEEEIIVPKVQNIQSERIVLIEDFTGVKCPNCPNAARQIAQLEVLYPGRVVAVAYHTNFLGDPITKPGFISKYDFRTPSGNQLEEIMGFYLGKPAVTLNRKKYNPQDEFLLGQTDVLANIETEIQSKPVALISITNTFNEGDRKLKSVITITPRQSFDGAIRLHALVTESDIIDPQEDNTDYKKDYVHNHVFRQMLSDLNGDALATSLQVGTPLTKTYEFILPTEAGWWVAKNCSVVAFISDYNQKPEINGQQLNVGYVLQAVQAKIK